MKTPLILSFLLSTFSSFAQLCNIDSSQTEIGIYPDTLPNGTVGLLYSQDVTFILPTDTMGFDFVNFHILSVALPVGLSWSCNNSSSNCNYNPQVSTYGCVHITGTPLLAGSFLIDITVIADLSVFSGYPFIFQLPLTIVPPVLSTTNNGFNGIGAPSCAPATVAFVNNHPGLSFYNWDFGNGNLSYAENPALQHYVDPGSYVVTYKAYTNLDTTAVFSLTNLQINDLSNYGGGFPTYENADAYFKIYENTTLVYQSSIVGDQNPPVDWTLNLNLYPNNSYTIEIWEADNSFGETLFGGDDFMGSYLLNWNGCISCSIGTSNVNYTIDQQLILPIPHILSSDTIIIFASPPSPVISYDSIAHSLYTLDLGFTYQWYYNNAAILGATDVNLFVNQSGIYWLAAINTSGCVALSDSIFINASDAGLAKLQAELPEIYPNPAKEILRISLPEQWYGATIQIKDLFGNEIYMDRCEALESTLFLNNFNPGIYLLEILDQTKHHLQKLFILPEP